MKRLLSLVLIIAICICSFSGVITISASINSAGIKCPNCGMTPHRRPIYLEIHDVNTQHYVIFCYDYDCDCGWNQVSSQYAEFRPHSGIPCGLCGHTGVGCTGCN